jgi:hypothetical protein
MKNRRRGTADGAGPGSGQREALNQQTLNVLENYHHGDV